MSEPRYPDITAVLGDGNAFAVLGAVGRALRAAGVSTEEYDLFMTEAQSGDYNHLLRTAMRWVNVELESDNDEEYEDLEGDYEVEYE